MTEHDDYRDWTITLPFCAPGGNEEGDFTEALFEAALHHAPAEATGMVARADTVERKVWITFTLVHTSRGLADEIASSMKRRIAETVLANDDACVSAS